MLSEIPAIVSALNGIKELAKAVSNSKVDAALREQAIESNFAITDALNALITLHAKYQAVLHEKDELEKRLMEMENWNEEAAKYTLTEMVQGVFVYALKDDYKTTAPAHWLCPKCYEDKKKSILQFKPTMTALEYSRFVCPRCTTAFIDHRGGSMP